MNRRPLWFRSRGPGTAPTTFPAVRNRCSLNWTKEPAMGPVLRRRLRYAAVIFAAYAAGLAALVVTTRLG